jgi:outer membrane PBP1 activator LpoA protein
MFNKGSLLSLVSLFVAAVLFQGCVTTSDNGTNLRTSKVHLQNGDYELADKKLAKVLKKWRNNHAAMLLKAKSARSQGNARKAVKIINELDQLCQKDLCMNEKAHMEALLLRDRLLNDGEELKKTGKKIKKLERDLRVQQYTSELNHYINEKRLEDAVNVYEELEVTVGNDGLSSDQKMTGFVLYYSTFNERAESLYKELSPRQREAVREEYGDDITF